MIGSRFSAAILGPGRKLHPGITKTIAVTFHPAYEGQYEDVLEIVFHDLKNKRQFTITRRIRAIVGSSDDYERLKPKAPYVRPKTFLYERPKKIVRVVRPPTWSHTKWAVKLPDFKALQDLIDAAFGPKPSAAIKPFIPRLTLSNYAEFWQALLWIEEEKMRYEPSVLCVIYL